MKNNYISVNAKYYKDSNASGVLGHVNRVFKENKNSFAEFSHLNFGSGDLFKKYNQLKVKVEEHKGKKCQKNSNTFVDSVIAFSRDQMQELQKKHPNTWQDKINACFDDFGVRIQAKYGFEPIGYNLHCDEGLEDHETGELKQNYHAHYALFNFDFSTGKAPLRGMKKNDWSIVQDLAGEAFKPLGFFRGEPKNSKKKDHLEKEQYIHEKHKEQEKSLKKGNKIISDKEIEIEELKEERSDLEATITHQNKRLDSRKNLICKNTDKIEAQKDKIKELKEEKSEIIAGGNKVIKTVNQAMMKFKEMRRSIDKFTELNEYKMALYFTPDNVSDYEKNLKQEGFFKHIWKRLRGKDNREKSYIVNDEQSSLAKKIKALDYEFAGLEKQVMKDQQAMNKKPKTIKRKSRSPDDENRINPKWR